MTPDDFISKWTGVAASELSTSQSFLLDLCRLLDVPTPHPTPDQDYMFERPITFTHGDGTNSSGRIDLYRRHAFVLESKRLRGSMSSNGLNAAMMQARNQAEAYARSLDPAEGRPPFVVVVDVGNRLELYSEFSRSGATYTPFPDPSSHRISLEDLRKPEIITRLRTLWLDPLSLDPSRESARVTREIAANLAELAKSLESAGNTPEDVAQFLMRCLFTMFAEDVRLLPPESFRSLLVTHREDPDTAMAMVAELWRVMDVGGFSAVLAKQLLQFNGMLFKSPTTLPLDRDQIDLLAEAARADWRHVEPAIFGTLLERALAPTERHKLGAHYTPRAYVERLILPTVIEPLRTEWKDIQGAALLLANSSKLDDAIKQVLVFHKRLCRIRVLDPACGSGNFLYVTLEHLKRLEGEVLNALDEMGYRQTGLALDGERADVAGGETVDPHNLLGIELNPRAAAIAEVVLWIGYLQWHFRTRGDVHPPIPVIRDFRNIECRDALLSYTGIQPALDANGQPRTQWDGVTMKPSPVTGEPIPDTSAQKPLLKYVDAKRAVWPEADYIVGNPPFIGNKRLRIALGDGYVSALRANWPEVPESADFVMYWWHHAAQLTRKGSVERFGLITTNSIKQTFNRRVIEPHLADVTAPLSLVYAVPDHPWVDTTDGAAVRIAMTVGQGGATEGLRQEIASETDIGDGEVGVQLRPRKGTVFADLRVGANVAGTGKLRANARLCGQGVKVVGDGFYVADGALNGPSINRIVKTNDVLKGTPGRSIIDFFDLSESQARTTDPAAYQQALTRVKPIRDQNSRPSIRNIWWRFAWERPVMRRAMHGLQRYFVTLSTAKHGLFVPLEPNVIWDGALFAIALDDWAHMGVLSSSVQRHWALAAGGTLEDRPTWTNTTTFDRFPFPQLDNNETVQVIRDLAERIDQHRRTQQAAHRGLSLTGMYNVLDKLRSGEPLTVTERAAHTKGVVSVLRELHDELDEAVLLAYGWEDLLDTLRVAHGITHIAEGDTLEIRAEAKREFDELILGRLVALNAERLNEESRGLIRWLRPDFQAPATDRPVASDVDDGGSDESEALPTAAPIKRTAWPKQPLEQLKAVAAVLGSHPIPQSEKDIAAHFSARGAWMKSLREVLGTMVTLRTARLQDDRYELDR